MRVSILTLLLSLAVSASGAAGPPPPILRNVFTTNTTPAAQGIVTNIVESYLSTNGITAATATQIVNSITSPLFNNRTKPIYYVDSVYGLNTRSGTNEANAWQTNIFQKLTNALGTITINNVDLRLARGSVWREELILNSNCTVSAYGSGPPPIINGADIVTNWFKVGSFTNSWAVTNFTITGGGSATWMNVIEDGRQLYYSNTVVSVDATPGTYTVIGGADSPTSGSATQIVIIHPRGNTAPTNDNKVYEITKRNIAFYAGNDLKLNDLTVLNAMQNNGSFESHLRGDVTGLTALNGGKHNALFESGIVRKSKFGYQEYNQQSASLAVTFSVTDGLKMRYEDCEFFGYPDNPALASGVIGHTTGPGYAQVDTIRCAFEWINAVNASGISTNGVENWVECKAYGLLSGSGWSGYGGTNNFIDCEFIISALNPPNPSGRVIDIAGSRSKVWISGLKSAGTPYAVFVQAGITNVDINIHRSVVRGAGSAILVNGTNCTVTATHNIFSYGSPYNMINNNTVSASYSNVMDGFGSATIAGVTYSTWGAYQAALPLLDLGSLTNAMQWIANPDLGVFNYADESPAVDLAAGPGWVASPLPVAYVLKDEHGATPERLATGLNIDFSAINNKLNRSGDTASVFTVNGSWTNLAAATAQILGQSSFTMYLSKGGTNNDVFVQFGHGTTNLLTIGVPVSGDYQAVVETAFSNPLRIKAHNNTLTLDGGGSSPILFQKNDTTEFARFDSSGNLGIGTNTPQTKLHVHGTITAAGGDGSVAITGSGSTATIRVAPTNNVTVTQYVGLVHQAPASVLVWDANQANSFSVTGRITGVVTVVVSNTSDGQIIDGEILGEIAGGTSRVITIVPQLGHLISDEDDFSVALATSTTFTLTNGNKAEISGKIRKLNGTNILGKVVRQSKF